jgi:predicted GNAT family N-acyltransferase
MTLEISEVAHTSPVFQQCMEVRLKVRAEARHDASQISEGFRGGARSAIRILSRWATNPCVEYPLDTEDDGKDKDCVHWLATLDGQPVGTLRFFPPPKSKMGRLCVLKEFRGRGIAVQLMQALHGKYPDAPIQLSSQLHARPFYERLGYVAEGPIYDEDGQPHQLMRRKV